MRLLMEKDPWRFVIRTPFHLILHHKVHTFFFEKQMNLTYSFMVLRLKMLAISI